MCDITAYLVSKGSEEKILDNVDIVEETPNGFKLVNIFGEERSLTARMVFYNNSEKRMNFVPV
ncbi:MAG: CooT family nickel-binding protein [Desulfobacteraceae bacterium]